jgi:hypothetical protein
MSDTASRERDGLVSSLYRNSKGGPSALVSLTDTSWKSLTQASQACGFTGHSDKAPVLSHRICEKGTLSPMERCFTLAVCISRCMFSGTGYVFPATGRSCLSSLGSSPHWNGHHPYCAEVSSDQCLQYSTCVQNGQQYTSHLAPKRTRHSSRPMNGGGHPASISVKPVDFFTDQQTLPFTV